MTKKHCYKCFETKDFSDFNRNKSRKDGLSNVCRECNRVHMAKWRLENLERKRQMDRDYAAANRERAKQKTREWSAANPERKKNSDKKYAFENKERLKTQGAEYRRINGDAIREKRRKQYKKDPELFRQKQRAWKKNNHGKVIASVTARKKRIKRATPHWLSKTQRIQIRQAYETAEVFSQCLGVAYHVDHIVPIIHPLVCGLHVPWNLQILTAEENIAKSNLFTG